MPRRRRTRKRRRNKQFRFRTGLVGAAGGRPVTPASRSFKVVVASTLATAAPINIAGGFSCFDLTNFDSPADPVTGTLVTLGSPNNHPVGHPDLIADGYSRVFLKNKLYRFDIRFRAADAPTKDFIFAYKFGSNSTQPISSFASGLKTIDNWTDMRQSRGWVWKRFSSTSSGGSSHPSAAVVNVMVPNIKKLVFALTKPESADRTWEKCSTILNDATNNASDERAFLHIVLMTIDGVALALHDIQIDVTVFMNGFAYRTAAHTGAMIEEAGQIGTDVMV